MGQAIPSRSRSAIPSRSRSAIPSRSDGAASGAQWKQFYESALLELNPQRLPVAITLARCAIFDRAEEILTNPATDEHVALNSALRILRTLEEMAAKEAADYHAA